MNNENGNGMKTAIMRPGVLVSLKTSLQGGVSYDRRDLDHDRDDAGADVARWETTRVIDDPDEYDRATKIRGKARSVIAKVCTPTSFGLLCRLDRVDELNEAVRQARRMLDDFNAEATYSTVRIYVLTGRIAESQEEATRAIASDVSDLLAQMEAGVRNVDVKAIRDAAAKAKAIGAMLDDSKAEQVSRAVKQARKAATEIAKRVVRAGEEAAIVLESISTKPIESARFAFLDFDPQPAKVDEDSMPATNMQRVANLDL